MPTAPSNARQPQDRKQPKASAQRVEATNTPVAFTYDGEEWTVSPEDATSLEFLAALEDEEFIKALRVLLGRDQAARLIKGRKVSDLEGFFDAMGEAVGSGNH